MLNLGVSNVSGVIMMRRVIVVFILLLLANITAADEMRPAYLELTQQGKNIFAVVWKVPLNKNQQSAIKSVFPSVCSNQSELVSQIIGNARLQRWYMYCADEIVGQRISVEGLSRSNSDVLLRLKWLDGSVITALLKPSRPFYEIPIKSGAVGIALTYLVLGAEHILQGVDHLLFVFALLLIVVGVRRLAATITAFTLAHSITLGAATLGWVHVPQQPVEAVIALSILFLAVELVHGKQGRQGMAEKWPWLIAFVFGLLHGFGFAGALSEIGLPQQAIPLALVFFNVGVELGQLLFVATVLLLFWILRVKQSAFYERAETLAVYAIGSFASFWLIERVMLF